MTVSTFTAAARALKERQKNRNLPSVEIPVVKEDELARTLQGIQEHLRMYEGDSGAPKERFVTIAELENAGLIKADVKGRFAFISQTLGKDVSQKAGSTLNPTQNDPVKNDTSRQPMKPGAGGSGTTSGSVSSTTQLNDSKDVNVAKPVKNEFLYYDGNKFTNFALFKKENQWLGAQRFDKPLRLQERADGPAALDGLGYLWVKDDTPNTLWFTDDAGTETQLGTGGSLTPWTEDIDGGGFGLDNIDRLEIQDAGATDTATFTHDGTDFNTAFANTTDWNITGLTTLKAGNYTFNVDETVGAGQDNFVLTYDNGTGEIGLEAAGGGIDDGTTEGHLLYWDVVAGAWTESSTSVTMQDDYTGSGGKLTLSPASSSLAAAAAFTVDATIGGATAFTGLAMYGTQSGDVFSLFMDQQPSAANEYVEFRYVGSTSSKPLSFRRDGELYINDSGLKVGTAGSLFLLEQTIAPSDKAGYGQLWVKDDTPNTLWFTDDAGTDTQLGTGGGGGLDGTAAETISGAWTFSADINLTGQPSIANAKYLRWENSGGTDYNMITLWSNNQFYVGDTTTVMHLRGTQLYLEGGTSGTTVQDAFYIDEGFSNSTTLTDFDTALAGDDGAIKPISSGFAITNAPSGANYWTGFEVNQTISGDYRHQFVLPTASGLLASRYVAAGVFGSWHYYSSDAKDATVTGDRTFNGTTNAINGTTLNLAPSGNINITAAATQILSGNKLRFMDSTNTDYADFSHDGTDFNTAFATTTDWNITGITAIKAGTVDADFDAITATSYGGITEANLVGKTSTETISGAWTFSTAPIVSAGFSATGQIDLVTTGTLGTGETTGMRIEAHDGDLHDVGLNTLPRSADNNSSFTLAAQHCGQLWDKTSGTAYTMTLEDSGSSDFPVEGIVTVMNSFTSGDLTITEGTGTTLYYMDPTSGRVDTAGGCTVGPGGVATIRRAGTTTYYIWGSAITA